MTYDPTDGYLLLYEGYIPSAGPACSDLQLWTFVHGAWNRLATASAPKFDTAFMTYDAADGYVLLFGGCGTDSNQTWTYADGVWKNLTSGVAPPAREAASMTYDSTAKAVVLFGGYVYFNLTSGGGYRANDTWEFQAGTWRNVTATLAPPARNLYGMASDIADGYVVLFGGSGAGFQKPTSGGCCPTLSDTWTLTHGVWHNATKPIGPSARTTPAFTDDPASQAAILFGGQVGQGRVLGDTWKFMAGNWQNLTIGGNPPPRAGADLVYDPIDSYLVLFGGQGVSTPLNDTWVVNASLNTPSSPPPGLSVTVWIYVGGAIVGVGVAALVVLKQMRKRKPMHPIGYGPD